MPSSNKTAHLRLNRWLGGDKPKKDDFNEDNLAIDEACKALEQSVAQARSDLGEQFAQLSGNVSQNQQTLSGNIATHIQDMVTHITAAERQSWNSGAIVMGTYTGTDTIDRKITLGYKPRFGLVFAANQPFVDYNGGSQYLFANMALMCEAGSSGGVTLQNDGFTVKNNPLASPLGFGYRLNLSGVSYVYVVWK